MNHSSRTTCKRIGVQTPTFCASTYPSSLGTLHVIKTFCTNGMHMHYMVPHHKGTAQTRRHRSQIIFTFCFLLFLVFPVVLFFIGSNGRIISHKQGAVPRGRQFPRLWLPTLMFFMVKPSGRYDYRTVAVAAL